MSWWKYMRVDDSTWELTKVDDSTWELIKVHAWELMKYSTWELMIIHESWWKYMRVDESTMRIWLLLVITWAHWTVIYSTVLIKYLSCFFHLWRRQFHCKYYEQLGRVWTWVTWLSLGHFLLCILWTDGQPGMKKKQNNIHLKYITTSD